MLNLLNILINNTKTTINMSNQDKYNIVQKSKYNKLIVNLI